MSEQSLSSVLLHLLGPAGLVRLAEARGGTRLYIPRSGEGALAKEIGEEAAARLSAKYAGDYIRVPLARELRARQYRTAGASNAEIARKLGMSESGVDKLFHAMPGKPAKGVRHDPRQGHLF